MKNKLSLAILGSLGFFALFTLSLPQTFAIGIRPVREEISLPPGQSTTGEITIVNETGADFMAEPVVKVFYQTDESGIPVYANESTAEIEDVRSWLSLPTEPVNVPANGTTVVEYTVNVPANAEAGGRYMSIAYQPVKSEEEAVSVNVRAASLLLINVEGDIVKTGEVTGFSVPKEVYSDQPFTLNVSFKNTGNTHVKPTGWIEITDEKTGQKLEEIAKYSDPITGQEVISDKIPVNLTEGNVLPDNTRIFKGEWLQNLKDGDFKATLNLQFDKDAEPITKETSFKVDDTLQVENLAMNTEGETTTFTFDVTNAGNIYEKLIGGLSIENVFGYKVDEILLPEQTEYLAPGETKSFELEWGKPSEIPEGRYTAKLGLNYGLTQKSLTSEVTFGEVDRTTTYLIIALVVVVLIAVIAIFKRRKNKPEKIKA